ncbi:MAG: Eco57I restriction-modification methylase domain-containing protein [Saprospiraceae bacterium]
MKRKGYNPSDIPHLIIEKNLFGFEIDERAAQLAGFSLLMKARGFYRRLFRKVIQPNILCFEDVKFEPDELENYLKQMNLNLFSQDLKADIQLFEQATNLGSLIQPRTSNVPFIEKQLPPSDIFLARAHSKVLSALKQIRLLGMKFHCVVDNPPYMGSGKMNKALSDFIKLNFPESKSDLMSCFMDAGYAVLLDKGFLGMINQQSWMYNPTYLKFRIRIVENWFFDTLLHLGPHTFPEIGGEVVQNVSSTIIKGYETNSLTSIKRLIDFNNAEDKRLNFFNEDVDFRYLVTDFLKVEGCPFAYWIKPKVLKIISDNKPLRTFGDPKPGLQTSNNDRFLRIWTEINIDSIGYGQTKNQAINSEFKWFPHNKGGKNQGNGMVIIH